MLSKTQKEKLLRIREIMKEFYLDNDNSLTYALTGLISELCNLATGDYVDPHYLTQKIQIINSVLEEME